MQRLQLPEKGTLIWWLQIANSYVCFPIGLSALVCRECAEFVGEEAWSKKSSKMGPNHQYGPIGAILRIVFLSKSNKCLDVDGAGGRVIYTLS